MEPVSAIIAISVLALKLFAYCAIGMLALAAGAATLEVSALTIYNLIGWPISKLQGRDLPPFSSLFSQEKTEQEKQADYDQDRQYSSQRQPTPVVEAKTLQMKQEEKLLESKKLHQDLPNGDIKVIYHLPNPNGNYQESVGLGDALIRHELVVTKEEYQTFPKDGEYYGALRKCVKNILQNREAKAIEVTFPTNSWTDTLKEPATEVSRFTPGSRFQ